MLTDVKERSLRAVKWTYLQTLAPRVLTPVTTIVLARLLAPEHFGLVAVATTTFSLLQVFQDMGLSKALIQSEQEGAKVSDVVFWSNLALSLLLYTILFVGAPWIAAFFQDPDAAPVIRILGLKLIPDALGTVHRSILIRRIEFRQLFYVSMVPGVVPLCVTIPLAYLGCGVWSLVTGSLTSAILSTVLLWMTLAWRPRLTFSFSTARRIIIFGLWTTIEALVGWFYVQGDNAIVGRYFSTREFGTYVISYNTVVMVLSILLAPVKALAYTALSRIQRDRVLLHAKLLEATRLCALISLPVGVAMFVAARPATSVVFGNRWQGMGPVFGTLAIVQGLAWIVTVYPDAYRAMGRPDIVSKFQLAKLVYTVPAYLIGAQFSLMTFVYTKLGVVTISLFLWFLLLIRTFPTTLHDLVRHLTTPILATVAMASGMFAMNEFLHKVWAPGDLVTLLLLLVVGAVAYLVSFYWLETNLFRRLLQMALLSVRLQRRPSA